MAKDVSLKHLADVLAQRSLIPRSQSHQPRLDGLTDTDGGKLTGALFGHERDTDQEWAQRKVAALLWRLELMAKRGVVLPGLR